ncbi:MAG: hypothetical protein AB7Q00_03375 [Phycisphaerales bacterium]
MMAFQSYVVVVEPRLPSVSLGNIIITTQANEPASAAVALVIQSMGTNHFSSLGSISKTGPGELWISQLDINGPINGTITSESITDILADGDISGSIHSVGSASGGQGQPGKVIQARSRFGSIFADIHAKDEIQSIQASQQLGDGASSPISITGSSIRATLAGSINADIVCQNSQTMTYGVISQIQTTSGDVRGSILAGSMAPTTGVSEC